jgi:hypothetical protein
MVDIDSYLFLVSRDSGVPVRVFRQRDRARIYFVYIETYFTQRDDISAAEYVPTDMFGARRVRRNRSPIAYVMDPNTVLAHIICPIFGCVTSQLLPICKDHNFPHKCQDLDKIWTNTWSLCSNSAAFECVCQSKLKG